ncbi:cellulose biosynthesis protein BcsQ [Pseudomonas sp. NFR16]|uniref:cellulose biosynthesis protein BcsQ n=1 Tax=Pseudomonas sp. NFR16 TaxID=1566248 RepID=UPI0008D6CED6|nr:cellulose biosynthesis protein BcsQ [Pseudomonas sp. NFR16]SEI52929.1 cellulose synthase operon protein YhjQ [Pseudomonas sp. NFR16]
MHRSDDIANLFSRFGSSAEFYREIEPRYEYTEEMATPFSAALKSVPGEQTTSENVGDMPHTHEMPMTVGADEVRVDEPLVAALPAAAGSTALSRLLNEIEQQREGSPVDERAAQSSRPHLEASVIAVVSNKGGAGRSTLAGALASAIKRPGGRTFAVDFDPQNSLCLHLGGNEQWPGIAQASQRNVDWRDIARKGYAGSQCLAYGVTTDQERVDFEQLLTNDHLWLARCLEAMNLGEQDTVVIDTPPGATVYLNQVLEVASVVVVVTLADAASYTSYNQMDRLLAPYLQRENAAQCKVVINQLDTSRQFSLDMCDLLKKRIGDQLLGVIRQDHFISESLAYDRNPLAHTPSTRGCQDTLDIAGSLCELLMEGTQEPYLS